VFILQLTNHPFRSDHSLRDEDLTRCFQSFRGTFLTSAKQRSYKRELHSRSPEATFGKNLVIGCVAGLAAISVGIDHRSRFFISPRISLTQERKNVRWRPGQKASLAPSYSNLRSLGSECTVLKKLYVTLLWLFGAPRSHSTPSECFGASIVNRRPGNCGPFPSLITPLPLRCHVTQRL